MHSYYRQPVLPVHFIDSQKKENTMLKTLIDEPYAGMRLLLSTNYKQPDEDADLIRLWNEPYYARGIITEWDAEVFKVRLDRGEDIKIQRRSLSNKIWNVEWTEAVPDVDVKILGQMAKMLATSRYTNHVFLGKIEQREDGNWDIDLIASQDQAQDKEFQKISIQKDLIESNNSPFILFRPSEASETKDGVFIEQADVIMTSMSEADVEAAMLIRRGVFAFNTWPVGTKECFEREIDYCLSKKNEDIVIIMALDTGTYQKPDMTFLSLMTQGSKLYWCDSIDDDLYGTPLEHGIWIGRDICWYDNGEDGPEWQADWERATIEDMIKMDLNFTEICENYHDIMDREPGISDIKGLFNDTWNRPTKGTSDDLATLMEAWVQDVREAVKYAIANIESEITSGKIETNILKQRGDVIAMASLVKDKDQATLIRWLNEDVSERMFNKQVQKWIK